MSTIRPDFHTSLVTRIIEDIYYQRSNYYYYLGKIEPWNVGDEPPTAPIPNSSEQDVIIRDNILYMKRITSNEVSLAATGYVWEPGTVFTQWDHTQIMQGQNFYCITDDFNVYKCLDNNQGSASSTKPTSLSLFPFQTPDGYLWKYMYNVPVFKRSKFNSRGYLPVQKALSDTFYNKGAVEEVIVLDGGSGYTDQLLTSVTVVGTTTGAGASAKVSSVGLLGQITGITILTPGTGYTAGATVTVTSSTGAGASLKIVASGGAITGFTIVNSGFGYSINDVLNITVGGAVVTPVVSHTTGEILEVRIDNPGAGYTTAPTLNVIQSPATGTGKYGHTTALLTAVVYQGSIVEVLLVDPGIGYPFDTATTIVASGDGEGASFSPVISSGKIVDVVVENPGTGYSYIQLDAVGDGEGAQLTGILTTSDFLSDQSLVEQTAVRGAIYNAVVTVPGDNYSTEAIVTINGDGSGASGYPVVVNGSILHVVMTSYGQNYTYATFTFSDPNRPIPNTFTNAQAYPILPPGNGHGYDAPRELYADTLAIYSLLRADYELTMLEQDYRQYGLIKDPVDLLTSKQLTSTTNIVTFTVNLSSVGTLSVDDVLINNNKRYRIVAISGTEVELQQLSYIYALPSGSFYKEGTPSILYTIVQVTSTPTANKYSGSLLYVTNSTPFTPTDQQSVAIRTYVKL